MLVSTDQRYTDIIQDINAQGLKINIPRTWPMAKGTPEYNEAISRFKALVNASQMRSSYERERMLTVFANSIAFPSVNRRNLYSTKTIQWARAFFVVSHDKLNPLSFHVKGRARVMRMFGGCCLQRVQHYHYVFVTDYECLLGDVSAPGNITIVGTSTQYCHRYIEGQLAPGEHMQDIKLYNALPAMYEWTNPYENLNLTTDKERKDTNYVWSGGNLVNTRTGNCKVMRAQGGIPMVCHENPAAFLNVMWCPFRLKFFPANNQNYRGEIVCILRRNEYYNNGIARVNEFTTAFPQCVWLFLK